MLQKLKWLFMSLSVIIFIGCGGITDIEQEIEPTSYTSQPPSLKISGDSIGRVGYFSELSIKSITYENSIISYSWTENNIILSDTKYLSYLPTTIGEHTLTLTVVDSNGLSGSDSITITVIEDTSSLTPTNTPPTISLIGDSSITIKVGNSYSEQGATSYDDIDGDISINVVCGTGTYYNSENWIYFDMDQSYSIGISEGIYTVTCAVSNSQGLISSVDRTVNVVADTPNPTPIAPTISLIGDSSITMKLGESYTEQGATAYDDLDGNISINVVCGTGSYYNSANWIYFDMDQRYSIGNYEGVYTVTCAVSNSNGMVSDVNRTVNVVANNPEPTLNKAPTANAGSDKTVEVNKNVYMSGSGSDIDGTISSYKWTENGVIKSSSSLFIYIPTTTGTHTLTLTVTDNDGATHSDTMIVTATAIPNNAPTANAGSDKTVEVNKGVYISGSGSDSDGSISSYKWTENGVNKSSSSSFTYTPITTGTHTLTLTVTDNDGATHSDTMIVTVTATPNKAPVANAGSDKSAYVNETITLIGSGTDSDGTVVSYSWKKGTTVLSNSASFDYTPSSVGTDILTLTVTDDDGLSATSDMQVVVKNIELPNF